MPRCRQIRMRALGARVERTGPFAWQSCAGVGVAGLQRSRKLPLDFGGSGTGCRLVIGAVARLPDRGHLRRRRLAALNGRCARSLDPLELMGAKVFATAKAVACR